MEKGGGARPGVSQGAAGGAQGLRGGPCFYRVRAQMCPVPFRTRLSLTACSTGPLGSAGWDEDPGAGLGGSTQRGG